MGDLDAIRLIGLQLNTALFTSRLIRYKLIMRKLLALKPVIVTVEFNDRTKIDFMYIGKDLTLPWTTLPDTALDADNKPISPYAGAVHGFNGGYGSGSYTSSNNLGNWTLFQRCKIVFTSSPGGKSVSQLTCWLKY